MKISNLILISIVVIFASISINAISGNSTNNNKIGKESWVPKDFDPKNSVLLIADSLNWIKKVKIYLPRKMRN
jgi:hypothetical protein